MWSQLFERSYFLLFVVFPPSEQNTNHDSNKQKKERKEEEATIDSMVNKNSRTRKMYFSHEMRASTKQTQQAVKVKPSVEPSFGVMNSSSSTSIVLSKVI